jgi:PAS domain S-box-containing protein
VSVRVLPAFQTSWSRLAVQSQTLTYDSLQLSQTFHSQSDQLKQANSLLVFAMVGAFAMYFVTVYFIVFRRTFRSITKLQEGTKIIGSGNLDYSITAKSNDEIGELSQSFNQMTANLKTVMASKTDLEIAQSSLRESEQRWATTLASIGDAVIATDTSGKIVFMNGKAEELTGWIMSEASQKSVKTIFNIINEQTRLEVESPIDRVLREGMIVGLAYHTVLIRKDASEVSIDDSGAPIRDKDGKTTGVVLVFRDITERKKTEEKLLESEERFSKAFHNSPVPQIITRVGDFTYVDANDSALRLLEFSREEFIGRTSVELSLFVDSNKRNQGIHVVNEQGELRDFETKVRTKSGKIITVLTSSETITLNGQKHLINTFIDITQRKKAEESLQKQAALIDLSPDAIIVKDLSDIIKFWSAGAEKLYGYTRAQAIGQNARILLLTKFPEKLEKIVSQLERDGRWSGELMHETKAGQAVIVQSWWLMKINEKGEGEIFESNMDITERRMLQEKLEESAVRVEEYATQMEELANQRLEQLKNSERLAAIGATAGMVGHDIRNPLQAITSDVYLAKTDLIAVPDSKEKKSIQESLEEIEKNVDYINKIVADLQDYARPLSPNLEETNLEQIVHSVLANINVPGNVAVKHSIRKDFPKLKLDQSYIQRILTNLSNNAIQAMPKGGKLTITAFAKNGKAIITVEDTGEGIPESFRNKLFTPLATTKSKGQGFGLSVVKRLTEGMGGTVTFESAVGKGTKFIIELPM